MYFKLHRYTRLLKLLYLPFPLLATNLQWQGTTPSWEIASNWNPNQVPSTTVGGTDIVTFTGTFTAATQISSSHYLNAIDFTNATTGYSISAAASNFLTFNSLSGTNPFINVDGSYLAISTISAPLFINANLSVTQNSSNALTLSGAISDSSGGFGLTKLGIGTLILSGTNAYSGTTTVSEGTLQAGATTAFPSTSDFTVAFLATLDLFGFSNTIHSLQGTGTVTNSTTAATLTVSNGSASGNFSGALTGANLALTASGGTLTLTGTANTYAGATTLSNSAILQANATGALSSSSAVTLQNSATLSVNDSNTINGLSGATTTSTVNIADTATLTVQNGGAFSGSIQGLGGLAATSGTLTLSGTNSYSGATMVTGGTLKAGATTAFPSTSPFTVTSPAVLDLSGFSNTISSLQGAGTVTTSTTAATLTISNGSAGGNFSGALTAANLALSITGGTLTLTGNANTYGGTTTISNSAILQANATGALSSSSAVSLQNSGTLSVNNNNTINGLSGISTTSTVTLGTGITLTVQNGGTFSGAIQGAGGFTSSSGTLNLSGTNSYSGATMVTGGTLKAGTTTAFPSTSAFTVNSPARLDLFGFSNMITSLQGSGTVTTSNGAATLSLSNGSGGGVFSGNLIGANLGLSVLGGTLILTGTSNTYGGATVISSASVQANAAGALSSSSAITLTDSGTLLVNSNNTINGLSSVDDTTGITIGSGDLLTIASGGNFAGTIQGPGSMTISSGTLTLSNDNPLAGGTTVNSGAALQLTENGQIVSSTPVTIAGTLDISGVNSPATINGISATGVINLGVKQLIIPTTSTISGTIQGTDGSLTVSGGTLTLSGTSSYTGPTTIATGSTIQAGSTSALAPLSDFTVTGTLDLTSFSNTIHSLSGTGSVTSTSTGGTLTVANGGSFSGIISGPNNLTLSEGTLILTGANTYSGGTTTISGGTLALSAGGSLPSATALINNDTFDISNINSASQTIGNLSGNGTINLGDKELIVNLTSSSTYSGTLSGTGGMFDFFGGTSTLTLGASGSNYTGATIINSGTLRAGVSSAFSAASNVQMLGGTLDLNGNNNTLLSLSGSGGTVTSASATTLTLTNGSAGGQFAGQITGSLGLTLTAGGILDLSGSSNTYSGATLITQGASLTGSSAGALSPSSAVTLQTGSVLTTTADNTINGLSGDDTTSVSIGSGNTLTINHGGIYSGLIEGAGSLSLPSGQLILSFANTFSGTTTIANGATLQLTGSGSVGASSGVAVNGILNIQEVTAPATVHNLTGTVGSSILLGSEQLVAIINSPSTYSGSISGPGGSFQIQGSNVLSLNGPTGACSYMGATLITSPATLRALTTDILPSSSAFTVDGTLDLNNFNNSIATLGGTGTVTSSGGILTVSAGGSFAGGITLSTGLNITGGTLNLTSASNTYSGATQIANNATLSAGATNALSASSAFTVNGSLSLNNFNNQITSLSGVGNVNTGTTSGVGILTVSNGGNFSGGIVGAGGLTLTGGTLTLSTTTAANTYQGATILTGGATLEAGAIQAFSPDSAYTLTASTLNLNGFNNTLFSLTGDATSTVLLHSGAMLTLDGLATTTFAGAMTNSGGGGVTITGGNALTLSGTSSYTGPTLIENGSLTISANGALSPSTDVTIDAAGTLSLISPATANAAHSVTNSGLLSTQEPLTLATFYTQTTSTSLDLGFNTAGPTGQVLTTNDITLAGTLNVTNTGTAPTSGIYTLLHSSSGLVKNTFATFNPSGFNPSFPPFLAYGLSDVNLFFSGCSQTWAHEGNGFWNDAANWTGGCVPGVNGNLNDTATFANLTPSSITVTLANDTGTAPQSVTLFQINFDASATNYTLAPYSSLSTITLDADTIGGTPQININAGSHTINAPIILNQSSDVFLADSSQLTLNTSASLTSASTQTVTISQSSSAVTGNGLLLNNTLLTPYGFRLLSPSVQNTSSIIPISSLTIGAVLGNTATLLNSGTNAVVGTSATNGTLSIGGAGTTTIVNNGSGARISPTGINSTMTIGSTGTTTITNQGASVLFGPTAAGSSLTVLGTGSTQILNSGMGTQFGTFGTGGNLTLFSGVVTNSSGGLVQAGSGGSLIIAGGSVTNDGLSTVGTSTSNLILSSGQLTTGGDVLAFNYVQSGSGVLQLNLSPTLAQIGNIAASGTATVGNTLIVNGASATLAPGQIIELITARAGVLGTYPTVDFINFPPGVIPSLLYTPNAVELTTNSAVTPQSFGSFSQFNFTTVNEFNILLERSMHLLHKRIRSRASKPSTPVNIAVFSASRAHMLASAPALANQPEIAQQPQREQHFLAEKIVEEHINPSRFYFGPIDSFGTFNTQSTSQTGFDYNSVGCFTGIDHAFETWGLGLALEYANTTGHVHHHHGKFNQHQLQATGYIVYTPPSLNALAIDMLFGYGYEWMHTKRMAGPAQNPQTAKGNPQGQCVDLLFGGEYLFTPEQFQRMPKHLIVTPFLNAQYIWSEIGDYKEHHAGVYNLYVHSQIVNSLRSTLGARFEYTVECTHVTFKPELDIGWQYEFLRPDEKTTFTTLNVTPTQTLSSTLLGGGRNTFLLGLDLFFTIYKVLELEISYDFQWNNTYRNNTFYLGIGGNF